MTTFVLAYSGPLEFEEIRHFLNAFQGVADWIQLYDGMVLVRANGDVRPLASAFDEYLNRNDKDANIKGNVRKLRFMWSKVNYADGFGISGRLPKVVWAKLAEWEDFSVTFSETTAELRKKDGD